MVVFIFFSLTTSVCSSSIFPPVDKNGLKRIDPEAQNIIEDVVKRSPSTKSYFFNQQTHQYTIERLALHQKIIDEILQNKPCVKNGRPMVLFTAGLPGSGKSTFIKKNITNLNEYIHIDADEIRMRIPEYKGWNATNTQDEVGDIIDNLLKQIERSCKRNIIYDGSMVGSKHFHEVKHFKHLGYNIYLILVQVPSDVAIERALLRYQTSGRYVETSFIIYISHHIAQAFSAVKPFLNGYIVINGVSKKIIEEKNFNLFPH